MTRTLFRSSGMSSPAFDSISPGQSAIDLEVGHDYDTDNDINISASPICPAK